MLPDHSALSEFTLCNAEGMKVTVLNYGATVTRIELPFEGGSDILLGFETPEGYLQEKNPYFNCIIGRFANRIKDARFDLDGHTISIDPGNDGNALHGGATGFDKVIWEVLRHSSTSLLLQHKSPDGTGGFPGNLVVQLNIQVTDKNELCFDFTSTIDQKCPVNLTFHGYFNLSGGNETDVRNHNLTLRANHFLKTGENLIPSGEILPVFNTPFDFTTPTGLRSIIEDSGGLDHSFLLSGNTEEPAAVLSLQANGRRMEVFTSMPCLQVYTANNLDGTLQHTKNDINYGPYAGICLEAQYYPDSPNHAHFPSSMVIPGEVRHDYIRYRFF
ncbi:MAG: galactose mutarotase [Saprospiraceae bacterium]|nr:galactose mutarotase [Saprospiraceae bacterium]